MPFRRRLAVPGVLAVLACAALTGASAISQDIADTTRALDAARVQARQARSRAELLEAQALQANAAADRTAQHAAAVAARIQQAEAEVAGQEAQLRLIETRRESLRSDVAARQQPLVRLTAALQLLARRPIALALFRPGSVIDTVHTRALIDTMIPAVQRRTAALRAQIAHGNALQQQLRYARLALRTEETRLGGQRQALAAIEMRQRLAARDVTGGADREAERALAMSEHAHDLGALIAALTRQGEMHASSASPMPRIPAPPTGYMLPLAGRIVAGFGDIRHGTRSRGISIGTLGSAQAVAPAAGRVAFAGPYRGYGQIVILTHDNGWTSLVTGLARIDVRVGDALVGGAPLGIAGPGRPVVTVELRHDRMTVNPLDHVGH